MTGADPAEAVAVLGEKFGVPKEIIRDPTQRQQLGQQAQQALVQGNAPAAGPQEFA